MGWDQSSGDRDVPKRFSVADAQAWEAYSAEKESAYAELNETVFPVH